MSKQLFRKVALERLSSPDQLDRLLQVTSPRGWVALIALGLLLLTGLVWAVAGTVSTTAQGRGVFIRPAGVRSIVSSQAGVVSGVLVRPGDVIYKDREVVRLTAPGPDNTAGSAFIASNASGRVLEVLVREGGTVEKGSVLLTLEPPDDRLEALIYVPVADGQRIRPGMKVEVSPATVKWSEFGYLLGRVTRADKFPASHDGMMRNLENEEFVRNLLAAGPCVEVRAELEPDPTAPGRYKWSSSRGPDLEMHHGTPCRVRIIVREQRPIRLVLPSVRDLLGF
jgi:pyruvate/2-oxoglutarate dehydrogenase complex dihydrolipoamide acyltransferase (E2) component